jgi:uncharacterized phage protein gp47/JayE
MAELDQFFVPTPDEIRDANLRVRRNALIARGVSNPNVTKDSDHYVYATALSENLSPAFQNCVIKADQQMPDTSLGEQLTRIMGFYGVQPAVAAGASGNIVMETSTVTFVAIHTRLIDDQGQVFEVTLGGNYANGAKVPVAGITTGKATDHATGDVLQWVGVPPAFAAPTVTVAAPGLTGGADIPNDEDNRAALFSHLQNPPGGGNWSQVRDWAFKASPSVVSAFVYPALNGPGTLGLCILGALTYDPTNGFTREVSTTVRDTVHNYVVAQLPGPGQVLLTTKTPTDAGGSTPDVDTDVAIGLTLPEAVGAGGPGGGWVDATPWPALLGTATRCTVQTVTDSTHLTLTSNDASTTPSATGLLDGVTQIAWFSPTSFAASTTEAPSPAIITATITSHGGSTGAITVVLDTPFIGIQAGDYVFPNAEHAEVYAQAFLAAMGGLGPGQWSTNPGVVPTANRRPFVTRQQPSDLTATVLKAITDSGSEVEDAAYLYRSATTPGVPASTTTDSPFVLVPRRFGLYDQIP